MGPLCRENLSVRPGKTRGGGKVGLRFQENWSTLPSRQSPQVEESQIRALERPSPTKQSFINLI